MSVFKAPFKSKITDLELNEDLNAAYSLYFIFIYFQFWWGWQGGETGKKKRLPLWSQKNYRTLARKDLRFIVHFGRPTMTQM